MSSSKQREHDDVQSGRFNLLNILCVPLGEGWRIYLHPAFLPSYLFEHFDEHLVVDVQALDFDDLERYMAGHHAPYEKNLSPPTIEFTARDAAAPVFGAWLDRAISSGQRLSVG
jgi:hypothetical protein